ncbi:MAG: ABC transporter substrate-binding protein, partial [Gaiellaceae bacterium]
MKLRLTALLAALAAALVAATTSGGATGPDHVTIAYQPGMGYAPLIIMRSQKTLETQYPNTKFDWKVLASGAAVTNGVIAGDVQLGAGGIGPFLLGWAKGVNWKLIAPLNWGDLWLMAKNPAIKTIADLKGKRVAMPSPTSIQGFVLRKMA